MRRIRWSIGLLATFGLVTAPGSVVSQAPVVYRIPITGTIENGLAPYVARVLSLAEDNRAAAAVLDLDTPGGRIDAAERIVDAVRGASIPVYAYVNPRAFSAGAMIALASDGIYLRSGGVIGAATPVDGSGVKASEKMVSAMRAQFRALAEAAGLDPKVAEGMVDETIEIPNLKPAGQLLSLTAAEAVQIGFGKGQAESLGEVLAAVGLPNAQIANVDINWAEQVVRFLTSPIVAPLLLSLGLLGLVFEIKAGSFGLGALVSLGSLGLFFGSHLLLGLAGWEEIVVLGLGLVALGIEVFVLPGFGVAGILGLLLIGSSIVLSLMGASPGPADVVKALAVLGAALVISASVFVAWLRHLPNSSRFRGLFLKAATDKDQGFISAPVRSDLVGRAGKALTDLRPAGVALIDEERVDVVTEGEFVTSGAPIKVIRSDGYRHVVRSEPSRPS